MYDILVRRLLVILAFWVAAFASRTPAHAATGWGAPVDAAPPRAAHETHAHEARSPFGLHLLHGARARMLLRSHLRAEAAHQSAALWDDTDEDDDDDDDVICPGMSSPNGTNFGGDEDVGVGSGSTSPSPLLLPLNEPAFEVTLAIGPASGHARIPLHPPRA